MTLIIKDRVKEISTTTGTGPIIVGTAPVNGFVSIGSAVADGNTTPYVVEHQDNGTWEVGLGQYFYANTSLVRLQVLASSNAGNLVDFAAGNKNVFVSIPAAYTALSIRDLSQFALTTPENLASIISKTTGSGSLVFANNATFVAPTLGVANATSIFANNGFYSSNNYTGTYSDGVVVDYVTGSGRISVGSGDGLTIYNGGVGSSSLLSLSSSGALSLGTSGKGNVGQVLTSSGSSSSPSWTTVSSGSSGTTSYNNMYYTATGTGVSTFSVSYNVLYILVFLNGVLLQQVVDYTATNGTSITLKTVLGDFINVITISSTTNPFTRYTYTAPNTSPTFSATYSSANYLQVFFNGVLLQPADYVATDNVTVTLNTIPFYNDVIDIISYNPTVASYTRTPFTSTIGQTKFPANFIVGFVNVYLNGILLQEQLDYSFPDNKNIILSSGAFVGDILEIISYDSSTFNTSSVVTGTSPIFSLGSNIRNISILQATGTSSGYLSSSDWITFNNKAPISNPTFTGNVSATNFIANTFIGNTFTGIASYAANVVGGSFLQIPYQSDVSSTKFLASPSGGNFAYLAYNSNSDALTWQSPVYANTVATVASTFTVPIIYGYPMYQHSITGLTVNLTFSAPPTGADGQKFILRIKDNGIARTLTWSGIPGGYRVVGAGVLLPNTTVVGKVTYIGCVYNAADNYWDVIAVNTQQ